MVRIPVPTLYAALSLGSFWWNVNIVAGMWVLALYMLSPALLLAGIRTPWLGQRVSLMFFLFGTCIGVYLIKYSYNFIVATFHSFKDSRAIARAHRIFYGLKNTDKGLVAEIRASNKDEGERVFTFETNLKDYMSDEVFSVAKEMYDHRAGLSLGAGQSVEEFGRQGRKVIELLEIQKREPIILEADQAMIDKMVRDHLYLVSRLSQMQSTSIVRQSIEQEIERIQKATDSRAENNDRMKILLARLVQIDKRSELIEATRDEIHAMEERMSFMHDALSLHGHLGVNEARIYLPSPLLAELQSMTWTSIGSVVS